MYRVDLTAIGAGCELPLCYACRHWAFDRARALMARYCDGNPEARVEITDLFCGEKWTIDCTSWRVTERLR